MEKFNFNESVQQVEDILRKVENPDTGVEESGRLIEQARKLLDGCYAFLRSEREVNKDEN